jgi:hypothetical protein
VRHAVDQLLGLTKRDGFAERTLIALHGGPLPWPVRARKRRM